MFPHHLSNIIINRSRSGWEAVTNKQGFYNNRNLPTPPHHHHPSRRRPLLIPALLAAFSMALRLSPQQPTNRSCLKSRVLNVIVCDVWDINPLLTIVFVRGTRDPQAATFFCVSSFIASIIISIAIACRLQNPYRNDFALPGQTLGGADACCIFFLEEEDGSKNCDTQPTWLLFDKSPACRGMSVSIWSSTATPPHCKERDFRLIVIWSVFEPHKALTYG